MKICAVLLAVWYVVSIIGFGVHTCMAGHHSCMTECVCEVSCENTHHDHDCCNHEDETPVYEESPCCADDFVVLSVTGTVPSYEKDYIEYHPVYFPFTDALISDVHDLFVKSEINRILSLPDSGLLLPGDIQSVLGIWRI